MYNTTTTSCRRIATPLTLALGLSDPLYVLLILRRVFRTAHVTCLLQHRCAVLCAVLACNMAVELQVPYHPHGALSEAVHCTAADQQGAALLRLDAGVSNQQPSFVCAEDAPVRMNWTLVHAAVFAAQLHSAPST